ncbi:STYKc [Nesidiocoris tenuis]|uniref:STYKc n=1 Tax=Nesidiocoris tenuis TaxID=355587 RepID=A0ABN7ABQ8_9HEMI|nr:STYKc [Nesidiocoris tenuis]
MQVVRESVTSDVDVPLKKERDECPPSPSDLGGPGPASPVDVLSSQSTSAAPRVGAAGPAAEPGATVVAKEDRSSAPAVASLLADRYVLINPTDGSSLHKCIDVVNDREYVCRVVGRDCTGLVSAHFRLDGHPRINSLHEVVLGKDLMYLVFPESFGDLHLYVRMRKRLREAEAKRLFRQVAETVKECHDQGVVLRDLKLRKFVFSNPERTELKLENLEDAVVLEDGADDVLQDKRGCPAYVSPEILRSNARYSGRAADMWSLGVILYTMLVGRYPFNDAEHTNLFVKITRGLFVVPEGLSSRAKCLIRSLLRRDPSERLTASDVLIHPWLTHEDRCFHASSSDQVVPDM